MTQVTEAPIYHVWRARVCVYALYGTICHLCHYFASAFTLFIVKSFVFRFLDSVGRVGSLATAAFDQIVAFSAVDGRR